jgi:general secretion pathway protein L
VAEHVFLRFGGSADRVVLARLNAEGQLIGRPESLDLAHAAALCESAAVTVLLPASEIVSCTAALPAANATRQRQMLPFSLEDEFAGDVDDLQFALGNRNDAGAYAVSVIGQERLDHWLGVLRSQGIAAKRICSEADGVADTPGVTTLFLESRRVLGRRPGGAPFAFDELSLPEVWQLLGSEREDGADLGEVVVFVDSETLRERGDEIDAWRAGVPNVNLKELADGALPRLAATLLFREGPNLLQGRYAPKSDYALLVRPWRAAAIFVLAVLALAFAGTAAEAWKLKRNDDALRAQIEEICRSGYATADERNCRLEMQRRLAAATQGASGGTVFLDTLAALAGASGDVVRINQLNFHDNVMRLDLTVPDVAFLDTFDDGVSGAGAFEVRVESSAREGDGEALKARLLIMSAAQ